jgi:hypothetical protein
MIILWVYCVFNLFFSFWMKGTKEASTSTQAPLSRTIPDFCNTTQIVSIRMKTSPLSVDSYFMNLPTWCLHELFRRLIFRCVEKNKGPEPERFRAFVRVAGAGFEPTTFGL